MIRRLLDWLKTYKKSKSPFNQICRHPEHQDAAANQKLQDMFFYNTDYCKSCRTYMCHVCSEDHIVSHCELKLGVRKQLGCGMLKDFNLGYLIKLNLQGLKCICGTRLQLNKPDHAICAACGMASCSQQCHSKWEDMGNCNFYANFAQKPQHFTMRSILFTNIANIQKSKTNQWMLAHKSGLNLVACYASKAMDHVYLQRGYRNYGIPTDEMILKMETIPKGIDFETHVDRVCTCTCQSCRNRQWHSIGNCQYSCLAQKSINLKSWELATQNHKQCSCKCQFCTSGIIVSTHRRIDCKLHCLDKYADIKRNY